MKRKKMTIGTITKIDKQKNLRELARLTLLNILSERGVIYTHYKNKQLNKKRKGEICTLIDIR